MRVTYSTLALAGALSLTPSGAASAQTPLTLADALARARERSPEIAAARLAVEEARGRLAGATLRLQTNPELDVSFGPRQSFGGRSLDIDASLNQQLEPGGRRSARTTAATAAVDQRTALLNETARTVLRDVAFAFLRIVHADERLRLLEAAAAIATNVATVSDRRYRAGDIAIMDVNLARASLARVRADQEVARAARTAAVGGLMLLLQLDTEPDVRGSLGPSPMLSPESLVQAAEIRPEVAELEAAVREAEAELRLATTFSKPDYGVSFKYEREEQAHSVLGGVTLTLPMFAKGQELRASSSARATRLRFELQATRSRVQREVRTAVAVYERLREAARVLEQEALPGLDENEALASRSFEVGQLSLPDLLLIRREILETRFQYLTAQLEAALARIEIDAKAGVLR